MTLKQDIEAFNTQSSSQVPPELRSAIEASIEDVRRSGLPELALRAGDLAPEFALPNAAGKTVALADALRRGPLILTFYRGVWCPYCNLELRAYQQLLGEIRAAGGDVIAISPQTPDNSRRSLEDNALGFEVLSDLGAVVASMFGLAYPTPDAVRRTTAMFGVDLDQTNGVPDSRLPISATYLIAPDRRIALANVDADFRVRLEPAEALEALRRLARAGQHAHAAE